MNTLTKLNSKKGFTIIELIVVVVVLGILVLLAASSFLGQTEKARIAHITNDIKAYENAIGAERVNDHTFIEGWVSVSKEDLEDFRDSNTLFDKRGLVKEGYQFTDDYYEVNSNIVKSNLDGDFIVSSDGKVYYQDKDFQGGRGDEVAQLGPSCDTIDISNGKGSGTAEDPYIVMTADDFLNISRTAALEEGSTVQRGHYILGDNIDMSGHNWEELDLFVGGIDGNGCTVDNLTLNAEAFIKNVSDSTIENLNLDNFKLDWDSYSGQSYAKASIFNEVDNTQLNNFNIEGEYSVNSDIVGVGVVGLAETLNNSEVRDSQFNLEFESSSYVYGLVENLRNGSKITNIDFNVDIDSKEYVYTFVGYMYGESKISNVNMTSNVNAVRHVYGFVSYMYEGSEISNVDFYTESTADSDYHGFAGAVNEGSSVTHVDMSGILAHNGSSYGFSNNIDEGSLISNITLDLQFESGHVYGFGSQIRDNSVVKNIDANIKINTDSYFRGFAGRVRGGSEISDITLDLNIESATWGYSFISSLEEESVVKNVNMKSNINATEFIYAFMGEMSYDSEVSNVDLDLNVETLGNIFGFAGGIQEGNTIADVTMDLNAESNGVESEVYGFASTIEEENTITNVNLDLNAKSNGIESYVYGIARSIEDSELIGVNGNINIEGKNEYGLAQSVSNLSLKDSIINYESNEDKGNDILNYRFIGEFDGVTIDNSYGLVKIDDDSLYLLTWVSESNLPTDNEVNYKGNPLSIIKTGGVLVEERLDEWTGIVTNEYIQEYQIINSN